MKYKIYAQRQPRGEAIDLERLKRLAAITMPYCEFETSSEDEVDRQFGNAFSNSEVKWRATSSGTTYPHVVVVCLMNEDDEIVRLEVKE